tara:strand:+ start:9399 stop:9563 length:165 start_codon:yes stop_codon:yes gene_type:complete
MSSPIPVIEPACLANGTWATRGHTRLVFADFGTSFGIDEIGNPIGNDYLDDTYY